MLVATCLASTVLFAGAVGCQRARNEPDDAGVHLIAARQALESGDSERARHELDLAIAARPMVWSYFERARLHAQSGDDAAAQQDVDAGLQLDAESTDLLWLQAELQKPAGQRFNGRFAQPPSAVK